MKYFCKMFKVVLILIALLFSLASFSKTYAATSFEASANADAWISSKFPNTNYGSAVNLFGFYETSDSSEGRILVNFDLSAIPAHSTINTAMVHLYELGDAQECYGQPAGNFYLSQITSNWQESTVTWNNQPGTYANASTDFACKTGYQYISVKNIIQGFADGEIENHGFMLIGLLYTQRWERTVRSRETGDSSTPKIYITYTPPTPTPTPTPTPSPTPTPDDPSGSSSTISSQTGISAGTGAAPSTKTSSSIMPPTNFKLEDSATAEKAAIKLIWQTSETTNIDGYNIYRSEQEADGFTNIAIAEKNITEFSDDSVESGKTYYYFIRSKKGDLESESTQTLNLASNILLDDSVETTSDSLNSTRNLYIILGASLLFLMAFLLFYELNWKKRITK